MVFEKSLVSRTGEPVPMKQSQPSLAQIADAGRLRLTGTASAVRHETAFFKHAKE